MASLCISKINKTRCIRKSSIFKLWHRFSAIIQVEVLALKSYLYSSGFPASTGFGVGYVFVVGAGLCAIGCLATFLASTP